jgi:hypothetical protein
MQHESSVIKDGDPDVDVYTSNPDDCSLAVLKGAVLFGHDPKAITSRISKFTYGIVINQIFKEGFHPEKLVKMLNNQRNGTLEQ